MDCQVVLTKAGGLGCVEIQPMNRPTCPPNEVLIKVAYAGINFADLLMRLGLYQPRPPYPFTPGYEASGRIIEIGEHVSQFKVGQRVVVGLRQGGQASYVLSEPSRVIALLDDIPLDIAAATPVTYMTAYHILHHLGHVKPHHSVLIHGGAGGVGTAALQLCNMFGVHRVWATSSASKHHIIEQYGAIPIDRHHENFVEVIKQATKGQGVDHVLDPIGGEHLTRSLSVVKQGGALYTYGLSSAAPSHRRSLFKAIKAFRATPKFEPLKLMNKNRGVHGIHMGTWQDEEVMMEHMKALFEGISTGQLKPVIDTIFDAKDIKQAHAYLHEAKNIGKVLLKFDSDAEA